MALATVSLLVLGTGAANAAAPQDDGPVGTLLGTVGQVLDDVTTPAPSQGDPAPKASSHPVRKLVTQITKPLTKPLTPSVTGPGTTPAATGADTAQSKGGHLGLGDADVAGLSGNQAQAGHGSSSAYADLLTLGGYTILGSHASSDGATSASGPVPANPLCLSTGGALCASLLYADSSAAADGSTAATRTGLADVCLGGEDPSGATCGGIHLGAGQGTSSVTTQPDGTDSSTSWTSLANLCLQGADACDVSADAVESSSGSGFAPAGDAKPTLGALDLFGTRAGLPDDAINLDVPKACDGDVLCAVLNAIAPGADGSSDAKSVADADGLGNNLGGTVGSSSTTSSASGTGTPPTTSPMVGTGPDFATGTLEHLQLADQQVLTLSDNQSQGTADKTAADAALLGVLGTTIIGSDASSDGTTSASGPVPANPLCTASDGALCLDLLYADSAATTTPTAADASTKTGVADLCLGGDDPTGATCSGVEVGAGQGSSDLHKDKTTGQSQASSSTSLANVCVAGDTGCTVSADALGKDGRSDSTTGTTGDSTLADAGLDGTDVGAPGDPVTVSAPIGCADSAAACVLLNQGDNGVGDGGPSVTQGVIDVAGFGNTVKVGLAGTATQATGTEVEPPVVEPPAVKPPVVTHPKGDPASATSATTGTTTPDGVLPNTGGVWSGLLGLALLLLAGGAAALVGHRRRTA